MSSHHHYKTREEKSTNWNLKTPAFKSHFPTMLLPSKVLSTKSLATQPLPMETKRPVIGCRSHDISHFVEFRWIFPDDFAAPSSSWIYSIFCPKLQIQETDRTDQAGTAQIISKGQEESDSLRLWHRWSSWSPCGFI
jgi:hypothetical protein